MGMVIWKYHLDVRTQEVRMPEGARILHIDSQGDNICLWAMANPNNDGEYRRFNVVGTGCPIDLGYNDVYLGTAIVGDFVWHVFELKG